MGRLSIVSEYSVEIVEERPTKCQKVKRFLRNKEKHTYCGLSLGLWGRIFLFYNVFFMILIAITMAVWSSFTTVSSAEKPWVSPQRPTYFKNPRLTLKRGVESMTIWYKNTSKKGEHDRKTYPRQISKFLSEYQVPDAVKSAEYQKCVPNFHRKPGSKPCFFDLEELGPCKDADYGYSTGQPCVYIHLNKMAFWKPQCYRHLDELPAKMPVSVKEQIQERKELEMVWIGCEGDTPADKEYMGDLKMYPLSGFNANFYPYFGEKYFLSPIIAIQMATIKPGYLISIRCTAWAKNLVEFNTLYFQIIIDMAT